MDHHIRLTGLYQFETGKPAADVSVDDNSICETLTDEYIRWLEDRAAIQCGMIKSKD